MRYARFAVGWVIVLCAGLASACAQKDTSPPTSATFAPLYAAYNDAIVKDDSDEMDRVMAPDFTTTNVDGVTVGRADSIDQLTKHPIDPHVRHTTSVTSIAWHNDDATLETRSDMRSQVLGEDGLPMAIHFVTYGTDLWVRTGGGWRIRSRIAHQVDEYRNGKLHLHKLQGAPKMTPPAILGL